MKKLYFLYVVLAGLSLLAGNGYTQTIRTVGPGANYTTLKAAFDAINSGSITGDITLEITGNTTEAASAVLNASGSGSVSYTSVLIYPTGSGYTITGNLAAPLINLNGADNVTFDGSIYQSGITDLTISNTSILATAGTSTFEFINTAENNTIQYCTIKGSETLATSGVIFFSTATAGNGNDGNVIQFNNITSSSTGRPINAIYASGSSGFENSGNIIADNNIYDFFKNGTASFGINLFSYNTAWSITDNSFYETSAPFAPAASVAYTVIYINNTSGVNFIIADNYIGGRAPLCGGSPWTKSNAFNNVFIALNLNVGAAPASSVQNNTIGNFAWSNSTNGTWTGINIAAGNVNIGTLTGNTIGATTGTGSITVTETTTAGAVYGINIAGSGVVDCEFNTIGSINAATTDATVANNVYGINKAAVAGTTTISNNTIGSLSTSASITASSTSTGNGNPQSVFGIYSAGSGTITINNNTITNLVNGSTNSAVGTAGVANGITCTSGTATISNNTISNISNANANNTLSNTASVCGLALTGSTLKTISGNNIYNLTNTYASFAGSVIGLYFTGNTGANVVSGNFFHDLGITGASSNAASVYAIKVNSGVCTYYNNIINLGGTTATTLYGIFDPGTASVTVNLYFNSVYIGGSLGSGVSNLSYALYSAGSSNTRNYRNNLFTNARSTTSGSNLHFGAYFNYAVNTGLTLDNNDYYATGTGGALGYYNSTVKNSVPIVTGLDVNSLSTNPQFATPGGIIPTDYKPSSALLAGITIATIPTDYLAITRAGTPTMGAFEGTLDLFVDVYKAGVLQSTYPRLKNAIDKINSGFHTGILEVRIKASTVETAAVVLYQTGYNGAGGTSSYSSVSIYPTVSGLTVTGNLNTPLIDLNGADRVTIDGRVNASGSTRDLMITNTNTGTSASTIRYINAAENNTVKYCTIKGSETSTTLGVIMFSTANGTNGNSSNLIDNNNITSDAAGRPVNAIYASGSSGYLNTGNTISNNSIYDFLKNGTASNGVYIYSNNTGWSITGNSFYETTSYVPAASVAHYIILINNASGTNFTVSGNYIGGRSAACGGSAWTKTNAFNNTFYGIYLNVGTTAASNVQNNTIRNISWSNSSTAVWTGIYAFAGTINLGTTAGNTIGAGTGTGSISLTGNAGTNTYGINIASTGTVDCENNIIGSVTLSNASATNATNFYAINKTAVAGTTTISNNTIGSTTTANSIQTTSASTTDAQSIFGIYFTGTGTATISNNTIANITNGTTNSTAATAGRINGILSSNGTNTISNNIIHDFTIANANTGTTNSCSLCGIALTGATLKTVSGNTIYNLSNTYASFAGCITGIYYTGSTGANVVNGNFIYGFSMPSAVTASSMFGIRIAAGAATYSNNIISLTTNTPTTIYGLYETGAASNNNSLYFNTIYLGGSLSSGTANKSYALYSAVTTNTRNFRNNILVNARSTISGSNLHYCAYFAYAVNTNLTLDYNDYYTTGTGGVLGYYNATNKFALPIVTGQDTHSSNVTPLFANIGGTQAIDYKISASLAGVSGTGVTTDYGFNTRTGPTEGAWEKLGNKWKGTISNAWNTAGNWTENIVPAADASIVFDDAPANHCQLDQNRSVTNLTNAQSTYRMVTNGYKLTIKGNLVFSGGAQIDASATGSTVEFAGIATQTISSGAFYNDRVYNLTVNNSANVALNGTLKLLNTITASAGKLDASTSSPTVEFGGAAPQTIPSGLFYANKVYNLTVNNPTNVTVNGTLILLHTLIAPSGLLDAFTSSPSITYAGTSSQTIGSSTYLNDKIYTLTIDNTAGVTLNTDFTVSNTLTINSGKLFTVAATKKLNVPITIANNAGVSGFVLQSSPAGSASLMHNTSNVPATVQRSMGTVAEIWHSISSPVANQVIGGSWLPTGNYLNGLGYDLFVWDEPSSFWISRIDTTSTINWNTVQTTSNFTPGRGYLYSVESPVPLKAFAGNLNNGTITCAVTKMGPDLDMTGFNLVGNPYPSSIDWQASSGWTRSNLVSSGGGYDIWIWNPAASNYGVCNSVPGSTGTNSITRFIAPTQAYFVRAAAGGNLTLTNAARVLDDTPWIKNSESTPNQLSLSVSSASGYGSDEILLGFGYPKNNNGAMKLFSTVASAPSLFLPATSEKLSVGYYTSVNDNPVIPVSFKPGSSGDYVITCKFDHSVFDSVLLEDHQLNSSQNMLAANTYHFTASKTDKENRFVLRFGPDKSQPGGELPANVYADGTRLVIDLVKVAGPTEVFVYDVIGRTLLKQSLAGGNQHKLPLVSDAQMLIVFLKNSNGNLCRKLLWGRNNL